MPDLRLADADVSSAGSQLSGVDVNVLGLGVCHDPMSAFGDAAVGAAIYQTQQIMLAAATSLGEVSKTQQRALQTIRSSMDATDANLANGAR